MFVRVTGNQCPIMRDRRIIDQSARRRLPPGPVDFMAVNNSNRRDRLGTDRVTKEHEKGRCRKNREFAYSVPSFGLLCGLYNIRFQVY